MVNNLVDRIIDIFRYIKSESKIHNGSEKDEFLKTISQELLKKVALWRAKRNLLLIWQKRPDEITYQCFEKIFSWKKNPIKKMYNSDSSKHNIYWDNCWLTLIVSALKMIKYPDLEYTTCTWFQRCEWPCQILFASKGCTLIASKAR